MEIGSSYAINPGIIITRFKKTIFWRMAGINIREQPPPTPPHPKNINAYILKLIFLSEIFKSVYLAEHYVRGMEDRFQMQLSFWKF